MLLLSGNVFAQNPEGIASNCQFTPGPVDNWNWTVTDPVLSNSSNPVFSDPNTIWYQCSFITESQQYSAVRSPFTYPNMESVRDLTDPLLVSKDFKQEDGWVLFKRMMGEPYFNVPYSNVSNPFFILYNRHRSMFRVFFLITSKDEDYNTTRITLSFDGYPDNNGNAMLAPVEKVMSAIDNTKAHFKVV